MKRRLVAVAISVMMLISAGCGTGNSQSKSDENTGQTMTVVQEQSSASEEKKQISMWFWAAPADQQVVLKNALEEKINGMQDDYELHIEFRAGVDANISTALAAGEGPDIVYTSGPSYVTSFVEAGKLENLDRYSEKYGWKDRLIESVYNSGTVDGSLYGLGNSLMTMGVFYNKKVLEENGWEVPKTIEEMETIMAAAKEKGLYGSVTGNKGWKPVNANYSSLFLNHIAGAHKVYECLEGEDKWNNPDMIAAINKSTEWYQEGYLGGDNYNDLNFDESVQLLSMKQSPFFIGPSNVFQWAPKYFRGLTENDLGFIPFPATNDKVGYPMYVVGVTACLSINANTPYKDECAEILDYIMTKDFMIEMTQGWPGYWAIPLKEYDIPVDEFTGVANVFSMAMVDVVDAINNGNFGFYTSSFFPPATDVALQDIDSVWLGVITAEELLDKVDTEFKKEQEKGLVVPIPEPAK